VLGHGSPPTRFDGETGIADAADMRRVIVATWAMVTACGATSGAETGDANTTMTGTASSTISSTGPLDPTSTGTSGPATTGMLSTTGTTSTTGTIGTSAETDTADASSSSTGVLDPGPMVDVTDPQLYEFAFKPDEVDPAATLALGTELAELDTTVPALGRLVVYLHGAGQPTTCGSDEHGRVLARMGFHVVQPCYVSDYGVANCGDDIGGCRLEAFEGVDHHAFITITPPDSIETRVVRALEHLQSVHPGGDWQYYLDAGQPRWSKIVISGISHGASSSGLIGMVREVERAVMLSGPLDSGQAWLKGAPLTAIDRFFGFTHTLDAQHPGHLQSFADMMLPGAPTMVDDADPPYAGSHRLVSAAPTNDGHGSTQAGGASPKDGDAEYRFLPVWRTLYGAPDGP